MECVLKSALGFAIHVLGSAVGIVSIKGSVLLCAACHAVECPAASLVLIVRSARPFWPYPLLTVVVLVCGHVCPSLCGEPCPGVCIECTTGKFPDQHQMSLPCGHGFGVQELDEHVGLADFYEISGTGVIECPRIRNTDVQAPSCPTCGESLAGFRRYSLPHQIQGLPDILDRMYAKFGRKMEMFEDHLVKAELELSSSFEDFSKQFRPSPLAGKKNQNLVRIRGNVMTEVQKRITDFRGERSSALKSFSKS